MAAVSSLILASTALAAVGAGVSAYGSIQQGKAQKAINDQNAAVNDQAALDRARDGRILANSQRDKNRSIQAKMRALYAKGGVSTSVGSPLVVQVQQAGELELGALEAEQTANAQASQLRQQAVLDRMAGKAARRAGNFNAAGTILSGAGAAVKGFADYKAYKGSD